MRLVLAVLPGPVPRPWPRRRILVLDALNLELWRQAVRRDGKAAAALAPYVAWSLFATALNADIWRRNR